MSRGYGPIFGINANFRNFNANFRQHAPRQQMFGGYTGFTGFRGGIFNPRSMAKGYFWGSVAGLGLNILGSLFGRNSGTINYSNSFYGNNSMYNYGASSGLLLDSTYSLPTNSYGNSQNLFGTGSYNNMYTSSTGGAATPAQTTATTQTTQVTQTPAVTSGDETQTQTQNGATVLLNLINAGEAKAHAHDKKNSFAGTSGIINMGVSSKHSADEGVKDAKDATDETTGYPKYVTIKDDGSKNEWTFKFVKVDNGKPIYQFDKDHSDLGNDNGKPTDWEAKDSHKGNEYTLSINNNNQECPIELVTTSTEADAYDKNKGGGKTR